MQRQWSGRTGGSLGEQRALIKIFRHVDIRVIYGVMAVVVLFRMAAKPSYALAQYRYFRSCHGCNPVKSAFCIYRNYYSFGQVILDRFAAYAGRTFEMEYENKEIFDRLTRSASGAVIVQSHVGNYEMAGYMLSTEKKPINVLLFGGETSVVMKNRAEMFDRNKVRMVPSVPDMSHVFVLYDALQRNEFVSMPGDRIFGSNRSLTAPFYGMQAKLPVGPFRMIKTTGVAAIAIFVMKERWNAYKIIYTSLSEAGETLDLATLAARYSEALERITSIYPYQWFNYFKFCV